MTQRAPDVFDDQKRQVRLGRLVGRGGEGAVYEVAADPNSVAKIYSAPSPERGEKLRVMITLRNAGLDQLSAWPRGRLFRNTGDVVGFLMPKIADHKDIHYLYSPKSRRNEFLRADWRFLIRASANAARAFATVHETGCVIGDVNHGGLLVAQDATVKLIDCDSFQVVANGRRFLCEVGVETFTPPELQGKPFKGIVRTANHDNFGLAVLIFLMLFMGRHPFAGRYLGRGDMPIPRAIAECRFPYGSHRASVQMEPPPATPPLSNVGDNVAFLFERAFAREMIPGGRPEAIDWIAALDKLEKTTRQCASNSSHWYLSSLSSCPWCQMEAAAGISLFPFVVQHHAAGATFNLEVVWRQITSIQHPGPAPTFASSPVKPSDAAAALSGWNTRRKVFGAVAAAVPLALPFMGVPIPFLLMLIAAVGAFFVVHAASDRSEELARFRREKDDATNAWNRTAEEWNIRAGPNFFDAKRAELENLRAQWTQLPNVRLRRLDELKSNQRNLQLEAFLDRFEIDRAKIPGIGAGRKQTLESYGIETAADVTARQMAKVPGFGPVLTEKMLKWRRSVEAKFVFDSKRGIDPRHIAKVEQDVLTERKRVEDRLRAGANELRAAHAQIIAARQLLRANVEFAHRRYQQAYADFEAARQ